MFQFQVGPGSKPGLTGRSLIWMKQIRHMYNLQLIQPLSSDSGRKPYISYVLLCNKLVLNLAA